MGLKQDLLRSAVLLDELWLAVALALRTAACVECPAAFKQAKRASTLLQKEVKQYICGEPAR